MWRPSTTRQTVSGVASSSPIGPHRKAQNAAETMMAMGDRPVLWPYSSGSTTWLTSTSVTMNNPSTNTASDQPGEITTASSTGGTTAMTVPMNGTKRMHAARMPHSAGPGMPSAHRPVPTKTP
jgi:hypothetical protein